MLDDIGAIGAIWAREVKRAVRDRGQLIGGISRPILWVLIMGIGLNPYFRGEVYGEVRFVIPYTYLQFIFPAIIMLNIMYTAIQSAVSVLRDREFGFLREVMAAPMSRASVLLGKVLGGSTVAVLHGCMVLMLARFANIPMNFEKALHCVAFMFLLAFALTAFGIMIANRMRSFESFGVFSNAIILPLYFTSSSVFPIDPSLSRAQTQVLYPDWLVFVVELNPLTYIVDHLRGILIGFNQFDPSRGLWILLVMNIVFFLLALRTFYKD